MNHNLRSRPTAWIALSVLLLVGVGCAAVTLAPPALSSAARPRPTSIAAPSVTADAPSGAPSPSALAPSQTVADIDRLRAAIQTDPSDAAAQRDLGFALAQRVRETADPSLYRPAMVALEAALRLQPDDALALVGVAGIQLAKHEFADALATATRAIALSPTLVAARTAQVTPSSNFGATTRRTTRPARCSASAPTSRRWLGLRTWQNCAAT